MNSHAQAGPRSEIVYGLPHDDYHASPGISNSGLLAMGRSPEFYYRTYLDPSRPKAREKAGQFEGTLAHCAILEPAEFDKRYVIGPVMNRNTKAWKEWKEHNERDGRRAIQADEAEIALAQAASVRDLPDVARALARGRAEVSAFWTDLKTGTQCRCRPDWVHEASHGVFLLDVKTYGNADPAEFRYQIERKAYHQQAAWNTDGYEIVTGQRVIGFIFVCVETDYPYSASAVMLNGMALEEGRRLYRERLDQYAECLITNRWPGYSPRIEIVSLPRYRQGAFA